MRQAPVFLAALAFALGAMADEPVGGLAAAEVSAPSVPGLVPLCRAAPAETLADVVAKNDVEVVRKACDGLLAAFNRAVHMENTVIWMGLWQAGNPGGRAAYTNRLDGAELRRRVMALTAELETHVEQIQKMIRGQGELAR